MTFLKNILSHSLVVFLVVLAVYCSAPVEQMFDSKFVLVFSQNLIDNRSLALDNYFGGFTDFGEVKIPHGMAIVNEHVHYFFPDGPAVLSAPYVAFMNYFGLYPSDPANGWHPSVEARLQRGLASLLTAGTVAFLFSISRAYLPVWLSWAVAVVYAFGTSLFSSASRALWSLTWGTFLLAAAIYLLVRAEKQRYLSPTLLATIISWTYFSKPTYSTSIICISIYMALRHRHLMGRFVVTGLAWFTGFLAYSWHNYGKLLPPYYSLPLFRGETGFLEGLAGNLVSPSRGLLIFSPFLLVVFWLLIRYSRYLASRSLAILAGAVSCIHLIVVAASPQWWGGHCYGPRLMTDALPWLALLTALALDALLSARSHARTDSDAYPRIFPRELIVIAVIASPLVLFSFFTHYRGAFSEDLHGWNVTPEHIENNTHRAWDWRDAQFLRGLR